MSVDAIADAIQKLRSQLVTDRELQPRFHLLNQLVLSFLAKYCLDLLSRFATDVTKLAMEQEIGPIIGRVCHYCINI